MFCLVKSLPIGHPIAQDWGEGGQDSLEYSQLSNSVIFARHVWTWQIGEQ